jgi:hypothetical protein
MTIATLLGATEIQLQIRLAQPGLQTAMRPSAPCTEGSQSHSHTAPHSVAWRAKRSAAPPQTHTRRVHTAMTLDEWQIRHHTHKSVAQQEFSLSPSAHTTMHARNHHLRILPSKFHSLSGKGKSRLLPCNTTVSWWRVRSRTKETPGDV